MDREQLKALVRAELRERLEAQRGTAKLYQRLYPQYSLAPFHFEMGKALDSFLDGGIRYLVINMPPRHIKSFMATQVAPARYIGNNPDKQVITGSYNTDLSKKFGREVRNIVASHAFHSIFPDVALRKDSRAAGRWNTNKDGSYISAAVNKPVTGFGADRMIIDDPHADFTEGNDYRATEAVWNWFKSLYTRKMPKMGVALIMQRMSKHDLTARLLEMLRERKAGVTHICFPAISDPKTGKAIHYDGTPKGLRELAKGVALWPNFFTMEELLDSAQTLGAAEFNAQYQQEPDDLAGQIIKEPYIRYWSDRSTRAEARLELPKDFDVTIQSWDLRTKGDSKNDPRLSYVVGQVWSFKGPNAFLRDQVRGQWGFDDSLSAVMALSARWPQARLKLLENKANAPAAETQLRKKLSGLRLIDPGTLDKEARLRACTTEFAAGNVYFPPPETHDWCAGYVKRLLNFPATPNDEGDATSQALNWRYSKLDKLGKLGK